MIQSGGTGFIIKLRSLYPSLAKVHKRIARKILDNPRSIIAMPVTELARQADASEASVVLFCKKLGFRGYHDFKILLAEELFNSGSDIHEEIEKNDPAQIILKKIFNTSIQALSDSLKILDPKSLEKAAGILLESRNILIFGTGLSGIIAKALWMKLFRINLNVHFYDNQTSLRMAAAITEPSDAVIAVSHSGSTTAIIEACRNAKENGAATIGLTNYLNSPMTKYTDILLLTSSRETGIQEEEMTSRIAQLAVIDALFVAVSNQSYERSAHALRRTRAAVSDDKI